MTSVNPALYRKAAAARRDLEDREITPHKALRLALSKSFDEMIALPLVTKALRETTCNFNALIDRLQDEEMLILLDGPDGAVGCLMMDRDLAIAIVEMQTLGFVPRSNQIRSVTRTDAAIAEPVINDVMARFAKWLEAEAWAQAYRFGAKVETVRSMGLVLDEQDFRCFEAELDIFLGTRTGRLLIALPAEPVQLEEPEEPQRDPAWSARVTKIVGAAQSEFTAIVHRYSLPLAQLSKLKPGDTLPVPFEALENITLYSGSEPVLGNIRLGQAEGFRALRFGFVPGTQACAPEPKTRAEDTSVAEAKVEELSGPDDHVALPGIDGDQPDLDHDDSAQDDPDITIADDTDEDAGAEALDFDFELPEPEPFDLDDLPMPGSATTAADDIGMPMAVVPIDFDDI